MSNLIPAQVGKHLGAIRFWNDGGLLLSSSNLTGRYWTGSIWYFDSPDNAPDVEKCTTGHELESGIADFQALPNNRVILALDSGTVEFLELVGDPTVGNVPMFTTLAYNCEHDDIVYCVSVNCDNQRAVTGSGDRSIKVWDLQAFCANFTYREAHTDSILGIVHHPKESEVFVSCSQGGNVRLWDTRLPRPAREVAMEPSADSLPTCVAWQPDHNYAIAIGNDSGQIVFQDYRQDVGPVKVHNCYDRPLHSIAFSPQSCNLLASCADETKLVVTDFSFEEPQIFYEDDSHQDFVRGVSWHPKTNKLYSCGWDKQVKEHCLPLKMDTVEVS